MRPSSLDDQFFPSDEKKPVQYPDKNIKFVMGFSENFAICTVFQIKDERRAL